MKLLLLFLVLLSCWISYLHQLWSWQAAHRQDKLHQALADLKNSPRAALLPERLFQRGPPYQICLDPGRAQARLCPTYGGLWEAPFSLLPYLSSAYGRSVREEEVRALALLILHHSKGQYLLREAQGPEGPLLFLRLRIPGR